MEVKVSSSPFGGRTRTRALLALRLLGESYPRELARLLAGPPSGGPQGPGGPRRGGGGGGPPGAPPPHGQALVILTTRSSLGAVALAVGGALRRHGIPAVLTGGACASLHTRGAYQSRDMDFILVGATTQARLDTMMASVGLVPHGDHI